MVYLRGSTRMPKLQGTLLITWLLTSTAFGAETIEAIGGEKCGGALKSYRVEFLAPEDAQVEARAKATVGGTEARRGTTILSVDGKPCPNGRCAFRATKGQTYKLAAESAAEKVENLCISVARP